MGDLEVENWGKTKYKWAKPGDKTSVTLEADKEWPSCYVHKDSTRDLSYVYCSLGLQLDYLLDGSAKPTEAKKSANSKSTKKSAESKSTLPTAPRSGLKASKTNSTPPVGATV